MKLTRLQILIIIVSAGIIVVLSGFSGVFDVTTPGTITNPVSYVLTYTFVDQEGHQLPATFTESTPYSFKDRAPTLLTNTASNGTYARTFTISQSDSGFPLTISGKITVGQSQFSNNITITVDKTMSTTITVYRKFLWSFNVSYTNGTLLNSNELELTSSKDHVDVSISNGYGSTLLQDATYTASLGGKDVTSFSVINDGSLSISITPAETITLTNTTTTPTDSSGKTVDPFANIPFFLLPDVYIYGLLGVMAIAAILASVVAIKRMRVRYK